MCATFLRNGTKPLPSRDPYAVIAYHLINYYLSQFSDKLSLCFKVKGRDFVVQRNGETSGFTVVFRNSGTVDSRTAGGYVTSMPWPYATSWSKSWASI
jgi:hypothetical protein